MKFEVGKFYTRRDGLQAQYMGINTLCDENIHVFTCKFGTYDTDSNGRISPESTDLDDIIGEWKLQPIVGEIYSYKENIYRVLAVTDENVVTIKYEYQKEIISVFDKDKFSTNFCECK